jgi:uncharacterized protein YjiK
MRTNHLFSTLLLLTVLLNSTYGCSGKRSEQDTIPASAGTALPYDLQKPFVVYQIEDSLLQEISGLGPMNSPMKLCAISDERGEIYLLNAQKGLVKEKTISFRDKGDFEGVECVGDTLYALQSNGKLYELTNWSSESPAVRQYQTGLDKAHDLEGLGYDPSSNSLLIACKEDPESPIKRAIWSFSLTNQQLNNTPTYSLDPTQINTMLGLSKKEKTKYISPSGVAVHPISKEVYILSSALRCLVAMDPKSGQVRSVQSLEKSLFPQPEGIAFEKNGDLWISSEGKKGTATLQLFSYLSQEKR